MIGRIARWWRQKQRDHKFRMAVEDERERKGLCRECSTAEDIQTSGYCSGCDQVGRL